MLFLEKGWEGVGHTISLVAKEGEFQRRHQHINDLQVPKSPTFHVGGGCC
jgi:hypothetical protein